MRFSLCAHPYYHPSFPFPVPAFEVIKGCQRARDLVKQILACSRMSGQERNRCESLAYATLF